MSNITGVRLVSRTVDGGRVSFNQVVMEQQASPAGVMLVAIDRSAGLDVWLRPHKDLAQHTFPQAAGYSRALPPLRRFLDRPYSSPRRRFKGGTRSRASRRTR